MSVIDIIVDAINPQESATTRHGARSRAKALSRPGDWLSIILQHHEGVEAAFGAVRAATSAGARTSAQKRLAVLLTGHANAEESIIYPALSRSNQKGPATIAYSEQATAKTEMSNLELLAPMSPEYQQKLDHIQDAVAHHMYEEEGTWFLALKASASAQEQATLAQRYLEEFERYVGQTDEGAADELLPPDAQVSGDGRVLVEPSRPSNPPAW